MKKRILPFIVLTVLLCFAGAGCSNSNIDTAKLRAAFASVQGDAHTQLETACAAIDAGNYAAAISPLEKASYELKMDKTQRDLLTDTLKKVHAKAGK